MTTREVFLHWFHPRRSNNHRPRILHTSVLAVLTVSIFGLAVAAQPIKYVANRMGAVLGYASNISVADVVAQINQQRQTSGESPLKLNSQLNQAASAKAQNMFSLQYWAHVAPDGTQPWFFFKQANYNYAIAGENLARDFSNTPDMVTAWMNSPTHKQNIMNAHYQETGVAVMNGTLLGTQTTLVVQLFGTPQTVTPSVSAAASSTQVPAQVIKKISVDQYATQNAPATVTQLATPSSTPQPQITFENPPTPATDSRILGSLVLPTSVLKAPPLFCPLQLIKAFFLAIIFVLSATLFYDWVIMNNSNSVRIVGKNLAHILLFLTVAFLLAFFKGGIIG